MTTELGQPREAAVVVPVYRDHATRVHLVLIQRSPHGTHGGHIALPGGKQEPTDGSSRAAAVREAAEELGLAPEDFDLLATLSPVMTRTSGFRISPFLARLRHVPERWRPDDREVSSVIDVYLDELASPAAKSDEQMHMPTWETPRRVPVRRVGRHVVWGVTLRLLDPLLPRLQAGTWEI